MPLGPPAPLPALPDEPIPALPEAPLAALPDEPIDALQEAPPDRELPLRAATERPETLRGRSPSRGPAGAPPASRGRSRSRPGTPARGSADPGDRDAADAAVEAANQLDGLQGLRRPRPAADAAAEERGRLAGAAIEALPDALQQHLAAQRRFDEAASSGGLAPAPRPAEDAVPEEEPAAKARRVLAAEDVGDLEGSSPLRDLIRELLQNGSIGDGDGCAPPHGTMAGREQLRYRSTPFTGGDLDSFGLEDTPAGLQRDYEVYAATKAGVKTARREHQWTRLGQVQRDAFQKAADKHWKAHLDNEAVRVLSRAESAA
eukprot:9981631-Lingulodinium_polyedra.AAC.1